MEYIDLGTLYGVYWCWHAVQYIYEVYWGWHTVYMEYIDIGMLYILYGVYWFWHAVYMEYINIGMLCIWSIWVTFRSGPCLSHVQCGRAASIHPPLAVLKASVEPLNPTGPHSSLQECGLDSGSTHLGPSYGAGVRPLTPAVLRACPRGSIIDGVRWHSCLGSEVFHLQRARSDKHCLIDLSTEPNTTAQRYRFYP